VPVDLPAAQLLQAMVEAVLYLATGHSMHEVAPVEASVLVIEPAAQLVHESCPADDVYVPAAQFVAPRQLVAVPLVVQDVVPPLTVTKYFPAVASVHVPVVSVASLA
jgi:hypothetical protein